MSVKNEKCGFRSNFLCLAQLFIFMQLSCAIWILYAYVFDYFCLWLNPATADKLNIYIYIYIGMYTCIYNFELTEMDKTYQHKKHEHRTFFSAV